MAIETASERAPREPGIAKRGGRAEIRFGRVRLLAMAAPQHNPVGVADYVRSYNSPDHVPDNWMPDRPGEIAGLQPSGPRRGRPGPDQGFALRIAARLRPKLIVQDGENIDDVVQGCLGVGLKRASMFSRAPVVHDLTLAFTIWGYFDEEPPAELVERRKRLFAGLRHVGHHYSEGRIIADMIPEATLQMTPSEAEADYRTRWRDLVGI